MFGQELAQFIQLDPHQVDLVARVTQHPKRPPPLRDFDQIYMLPGSQLIQAKLIADYLHRRQVVLVGDGDCMSLVLGYLGKQEIIEAPHHMLVLDFDARILQFIENTATELGLPEGMIETVHYNVRNPIPREFAGTGDVFYTNPPYGSGNKGESGKVFLGRCMELCKPSQSWGVAILPFEHHTVWSRDAMASIQIMMTASGYVVSEMIRGLHLYHLDDRPSLFSGTVVFDRVMQKPAPYAGRTLTEAELKKFYGKTDRRVPDYIDMDGKPVFQDAATE